MGFAVLLMTQLTKDTPVPMVWLWMFIAGLGVGPTFSVPTIVIQNAVPFRQLGVATSNLTFFRQIGGTIALAFVGTIFGTTFKDHLVPQMSAAGVPPQVVDGLRPGERQRIVRPQQADRRRRHGRGASWPRSRPSSRTPSSPFIGAMVEGIHGAFSLATAQTFWLGVVGAVVAGHRGGRDQGDPAAGLQRAAARRRRQAVEPQGSPTPAPTAD